MSRVIPTKRIVDIYLGAKSHYDNREEHIQSLNHRIGYLEKQHYKVKNNKLNFTDELRPIDKELLSYIEAKLEATQKLRKKVIEDETLQEPRTSTDESSLPPAHEAAQNFIEGAKTTNTGYSIDDYTFVMNYAREHADVTNVSKLIRDLRALKDCPAKLKNIDTEAKPERRWIKFYHQYSSTVRN